MPQSPTCSGVKIRSVHDAQVILYACHIGRLEMIKTRLDSADRHALASGNVYAWEERSPRADPMGSGIERFTEGKRWTASRLRDDFLFYYEKYLHLSEHDQKIVSPPRDWDPFVKQTYSAWVNTENGNRKWHLTAYYTQRTEDRLGTIDDISALRDIVVPPGYFLSNADIRSNKPVDVPHTTQRAYNPLHQTPRPLHNTPSPDLPNQPSPHSSASSVFSHAPTSQYDHLGDRFSNPPRYIGTIEDIGSHPIGYLPRLADGLGKLPSVTHNPGARIVSRTRPAPYHDPHSTGHRAIPRANANEPPPSLVPMDNLIAHHPFPRDFQDEQVLRVFVPRLE
ncbi:hypothetical protein BJ322DRAFT_1016786 [Thelephora terrestris]|uniref:cAMP-independent regulatory protein pac2 n=1 Tax=Thelephora terrestris TaxID=56493 RepID=A0A9P6HR46_9AGAM|nr:hypothetical protein BJ322DRAFT_1016786 [Thelephora terrestris]